MTSSVLAAVGYDEQTRTLEIRFHDGSLYRYLDVPPEVVLDLLQAPSLGRFFSAHVRESYPHQRLR